MIRSFDEIERIFHELDDSIINKTNVYMIGGATLLKRGLKDVTKDIDLVVSTKNEFIDVQNALKKIGFKSQIPGKEYTHLTLSQIFQRDDFRIDLFEKAVCGRFSLTKGMIYRAIKAIDFEHISLFLCSNEDIFLFKTMTEREGDLNDCISIAGSQKLDWNTILEELQSQIKQSKQDVWITWVAERLDLLVERGLDIPIMKEIDKIREKFLDDYEKKHS